MKYFLLSLVCMLFAQSAFAVGEAASTSRMSALLPQPNTVKELPSAPFRIRESRCALYASTDGLSPAVRYLQRVVKHRMGRDLAVVDSPEKASFRLLVDGSLQENGHYRLQVDRKGVCLTGASEAAVYYAVATLDQWLMGSSADALSGRIPAVWIDDAPRFPFRGLMLDPARHFLPLKDVKFFVDQMARYKYNVLQLHLTDDQGWRVELDGYPQLSARQAYTADELRELVAYAAERYVEVIPELDIPGHTAAFLSAYPGLGCAHLQTDTIQVGTTVNRMLCAANDSVYVLFGNILRQVAAIFPSPYIHLGGDEAAVPANWAKCPRCRKMMKDRGYTQPTQLMIPFFNRMLAFVRQEGKRPILWCELNKIYPPADDYLFPYPEDVTLVSWRGGLTPTCLELTRKSGHPLIMAPGEHAYLDYPQLQGDLPEFDNWGMPVTTLRQCYALDPGYGQPESDQQHVLGVLGTLWGEAMRDINRVTYMAYPRALALAEAGWTRMENRNWESFRERLLPNLSDLMRRGVSVRVPFEIFDREQ